MLMVSSSYLRVSCWVLRRVVLSVRVAYIFFEDHFDAVDPYDHSSIPYDKLDGIHETPTNFYLMTALSSGIILRKEDLPEGASEFLRGVQEKYQL